MSTTGSDVNRFKFQHRVGHLYKCHIVLNAIMHPLDPLSSEIRYLVLSDTGERAEVHCASFEY